MSTFFNIMMVLALLAVLGALGGGLYSMARGGEYNKKNANRFMRWRVILQAVALVILAVGIYATRK
ncbi:twin transmembrane helix small protein [Denitrobaculum tricleocarpae]|uniref:Twin transmembrane helix small protein n=1 Tax=Denitrobaculum tricleocarpae TaxID=2591009 RepID=A0A545U1Q4_9PROT|nr:twin transmembrane helix small protein [Denitrobaculum tricleocarpae]TQV83411.1 twin transmembrane helix small protein [Denitrobaculum tricleocarpae]